MTFTVMDGELNNFIYCLLLKTKDLRDLPGILDCDDYMDSSKVATFRGIAVSEFLTSRQFGKDLLSYKTNGIQDFRGH